MLDGMDVMVISYSSTQVTQEWGITAGELGIVFSAALLGMTLGALFIAPIADLIGRRKMVFLGIVTTGIGCIITARMNDVTSLVVLRFITGLGIGMLLASTATLAAEYAPHRFKNLFVSIVMSGYPIGATLSGLVAAQVIPAYGWRTMFDVAGIFGLLTLPLAFFFMPESWDWLLKKQPANALEKVNAIVRKMSLPTLDRLPPLGEEAKKNPMGALFTHGRATITIQLWIAFFLAFATLYFLTAWIPKLASDAGMAVDLAIYAGTAFNLGAIFGIWLQGYLSQSFGLRPTIIGFFIFTVILMGTFGYLTGDYAKLISFTLIGFGIQGGFIGMYALAARLYPTEIRTSGVGGAIGAGRTGAIASPIIGGQLVAVGFSMAASFIIFAVPLLVVCGAMMMMRSKELDINTAKGVTIDAH
jgi:benzoate transport